MEMLATDRSNRDRPAAKKQPTGLSLFSALLVLGLRGSRPRGLLAAYGPAPKRL